VLFHKKYLKERTFKNQKLTRNRWAVPKRFIILKCLVLISWIKGLDTKSFKFLKAPSFKWFFMKNHNKNPLFDLLSYNHKGFGLFSEINFGSLWAFEGLKICKIMYFVLPFWFMASIFLVLTPLSECELLIPKTNWVEDGASTLYYLFWLTFNVRPLFCIMRLKKGFIYLGCTLEVS